MDPLRKGHGFGLRESLIKIRGTLWSEPSSLHKWLQSEQDPSSSMMFCRPTATIWPSPSTPDPCALSNFSVVELMWFILINQGSRVSHPVTFSQCPQHCKLVILWWTDALYTLMFVTNPYLQLIGGQRFKRRNREKRKEWSEVNTTMPQMLAVEWLSLKLGQHALRLVLFKKAKTTHCQKPQWPKRQVKQ